MNVSVRAPHNVTSVFTRTNVILGRHFTCFSSNNMAPKTMSTPGQVTLDFKKKIRVKHSGLAKVTHVNWRFQTGRGFNPLSTTITQQTQSISITFIQCWGNVEDVGPELHKCYTNVLCLLGIVICKSVLLEVKPVILELKRFAIFCSQIITNMSNFSPTWSWGSR